jgi:hypothetical protein
MAYVQYTAKDRKIIELDFSAAGTDISAAASDDSFNSTTTDLSGLLAGNWIKVSGFTETANNGWHQLASDSTSTKIVTNSILTTESAGDAVSMQGYEHGSGELYSIDFDGSMIYPTHSPDIEPSIAENGYTESVINRIDYGWTVTTTLRDLSARGSWREFLASVANYESFTFDPDGTSSVPISPVTVVMEGKQDFKPVDQTGQFRVNFQVRELP